MTSIHFSTLNFCAYLIGATTPRGLLFLLLHRFENSVQFLLTTLNATTTTTAAATHEDAALKAEKQVDDRSEDAHLQRVGGEDEQSQQQMESPGSDVAEDERDDHIFGPPVFPAVPFAQRRDRQSVNGDTESVGGGSNGKNN